MHAPPSIDHARSPEDCIGALALPVPPLHPQTPALTAHEAFAAAPTLYAIAVVEDDGTPVGVLNRFKFLESLSRPYGRDLLMRQRVSVVMDPAPLIVDEGLSLDDLSSQLTVEDSRYLFDGFIVTRQGRYIGIGTGLGVFRSITERRHSALLHMAQHDALTRLPNRECLQSRLHEALTSIPSQGERTALLYIDLDRFKSVNDTFGHAVGDLLLRSIATRLVERVRAADTVARLSGDEFAIVLRHLHHEDDAEHVAAALLDCLKAPHVLESQEVNISCSIGIAVHPTDATTPAGLLRAADAAAYHAKQFRNTYQRASTAILTTHPPSLNSFGAVRRAIEAGHLTVVYQPQVSARTGLTIGVEALVRWTDPKHGPQPAIELVRLAEDAGLIADVTNFVVGRAMSDVMTWRRRGLIDELSLAINISAAELREGLLLPRLDQHLHDTGFPPTSLELEITETAVMSTGSEARELLTVLAARGLRLSIDDFGTGYSSLSRLQRLPVHALKIDRSFVEEIGRESNGALARAVILMAHSLGLSVTGEGVETLLQRNFLREHGCDLMQGFFFGRPMQAEQLAKHLAVERESLTLPT